MLTQQLIFLQILISGAFAVLTAQDYLQFDCKREFVLSEYVNYWNDIAVVNDAVEIIYFRDLEPTKKQVMAQLFERVVAINLSIMLRGCSIYYARSKNPIDAGNPDSPDYNIGNLVEDIDLMLDDLIRMDQIFISAQQDFDNVFQQLQQNSHGNIPAHQGSPFELTTDYYKNVLQMLAQFFGDRIIRTHNYFNAFFKVELSYDTEDIIPSFEFFEAYLDRIQFIESYTELAESQDNVNLIFMAETNIFLGLADKNEIEQNQLSNSWYLKSEITSNSDYVFEYTLP